MKIIEIVNGIADKSINRNEIAKQYGISVKTFSTHLAKTGYTWDKSTQKHYYAGNPEEKETIDNMEFKDFITVAKHKPKPDVFEAVATSPSKQRTGAGDEFPPSAEDDSREIKVKYSSDLIDFILHQNTTEKAYRGFYLDDDVIAVLDKIGDGNKSKLVNEALKIVFKEKGLM